MLNVFCILTGVKYPVEYVEKLKNMVSNNLTLEHKFICLTDRTYKYQVEGVEFVKALIPMPDNWAKLALFHPKMKDLGFEGDALYFDLDVVITGRIDGLIERSLRDKQRLSMAKFSDDSMNSCVMTWEIGKFKKIFSQFKVSDMQKYELDEYILSVLTKHELRQFGIVEVQNYKIHNLVDSFKKETKIISFDKSIKPHVIKDSWVREYWK